MTDLLVNGTRLLAVSAGTLAEQLARLAMAERAELWVERSSSSSLCLLKSGGRSLLMLMRSPGDPGLTSRTNLPTSAQAFLNFRLANGQIDKYSSDWTVSFADAGDAVEYFFNTGDPAPFIDWHDEAASTV